MEAHGEQASDEVLNETGQRMLKKCSNQYATLELSFWAGAAIGLLSALALVGTWYLNFKPGGH